MDDNTEEYDQFNQHFYFTEDGWAQDVRDGDTHLGYADWVAHRLEYTRGELAYAERELADDGGRGIELAEYIDQLRLQLEPASEDLED